MADPYTCPACGWDSARDFTRHLSLGRIGKGNGVFTRQKGLPSPEREEFQKMLEKALAENQRLQKEIERLQGQEPAKEDLAAWETSVVLRFRQGEPVPKTLEIPAQWNGIPVRELGQKALFRQKELQKVILPEGLIQLGRYSFACCENLREVHFPTTLQVIEDNAFSSCARLREIRLPEGLQELGPSAFAFCTGLGRIELPSTLQAIGYNAFLNCESLLELEIPNKVWKIEPMAFLGCLNLRRMSLPGSWKRRKDVLKQLGQAAVPRGCRVEYR